MATNMWLPHPQAQYFRAEFPAFDSGVMRVLRSEGVKPGTGLKPPDVMV